MRSLPGAAAAAALLVLAVTAISPASALPLRDRGPGSFVRGDGDRWLVVGEPGRATATNTLTGQRRTLAPGPGCALRDAHRGLALFSCDEPLPGRWPAGQPVVTYGQPYVLRLRTGSVRRVPNAVLSSAGNYGGRDPGWSAVGAYWLGGFLGCYHCEGRPYYVNWRTGERREGDGSFLEESTPLDMDDADLRPPARVPRPEVRAVMGGDGTTRVMLGRRTLSRCPKGCSWVAAGPAGHYAWTEGSTIRGYVTRTHRRTTWILPPSLEAAGGSGFPAAPIITRGRVTAVVQPRAATPPHVVTGAWPGG
jgi:hypothetical protein